MKNNDKIIFIISILGSFFLVLLIYLFNPITSDVFLLPDKGPSWYYWKLPTRDTLTMVIVWGLFIIHLLGNYFLIRKRMVKKERSFIKENFYLLFFNLIFILLHFIQTIFFYDGLAQDVPIFSSQYSVILILVTLILMQINNRGIFFNIKIKVPQKAMKLLYSIHGIIFTFAIVYTFWFHPVVFTIGHAIGFLYIFLLFIQIIFIKTKIHYNKYWIVILELLVAFHGASVAYFVQDSPIWPMFLFGFLFIFIATQIYSLNIKKTIRLFIQISYFLIVFVFYLNNNIYNIHQILWIPIIEYIHVFIFLIILKLIYKKN